MQTAMRPSSWPVSSSDMGALIRSQDWSESPLGPLEAWPQSLKSAVELVLGAPLAMMVLWGPDLVQLYNDACRDLIAAKHPGALGRPFRESWPELSAFTAPAFEAVSRGESRSFSGERLTVERDGTSGEAWFDLTYSPLRNDEGKVAGVLVTIMETTSRVQASRNLVAETNYLRELFRQAPGFMASVQGPDHRFELANDAYYQVVGHRDLIGRTVCEALPELEGQGFFELLDQVYRTGEPFVGYGVPIKLQRRPGGPLEDRFVNFVYQPVRDAEGHVTGIFAEGQDVTDAKLAEVALRESEARFRAIFEQAEIGIAMVDLEGRIIFVNDRWCDLVGVSQDRVIGRTVREVTHPEDWMANEPHFRRVLTKGVPFTIEKRYVRPDGSFVWVRNAVGAMRDAEGRITGCFAMSLDISDRRSVEEALRDSEAKFRDVANSIPVMIWLADPSAACTYLNRRWTEFTGQDAEEGLGGTWLSAIHPDDRPEVGRAWLAASATREPFRFEFRLRRHDGTYRWVMGDGVPRFDPEGHLVGYAGSITDIHERREAEQRQTLLAREVDHRARNALAVVQALVRLTQTNRPEDFYTAVEGRVAALARAHGMLAESSWTGADLRTLVSDELAPYLGRVQTRAILTGPPVVIAPDAVQSMNMVLHELTTNAAKYGALSAPDGWLEVRWTVSPDGLWLKWQERGGPPLTGAPEGRGFGSKIIQSAAAQIGGRVILTWAPDGLRCVLTVEPSALTLEGRSVGGTSGSIDAEKAPNQI